MAVDLLIVQQIYILNDRLFLKTNHAKAVLSTRFYYFLINFHKKEQLINEL